MSGNPLCCPRCGCEIDRTLDGKSVPQIKEIVRRFRTTCERQGELSLEVQFGSLVDPFACPPLREVLRSTYQ